MRFVSCEWLELWLRVDVELEDVEDPLDQTRIGAGRGMLWRGGVWICKMRQSNSV